MAVSVAVRWGRPSTPPQGCDEGVSRRGRRVGRCPVISHQRRRGGTPCRGDCAARHHRAPQDRMRRRRGRREGGRGRPARTEGEGGAFVCQKGKTNTFQQHPPRPRPRSSGVEAGSHRDRVALSASRWIKREKRKNKATSSSGSMDYWICKLRLQTPNSSP